MMSRGWRGGGTCGWERGLEGSVWRGDEGCDVEKDCGGGSSGCGV